MFLGQSSILTLLLLLTQDVKEILGENMMTVKGKGIVLLMTDEVGQETETMEARYEEISQTETGGRMTEIVIEAYRYTEGNEKTITINSIIQLLTYFSRPPSPRRGMSIPTFLC